MKYADMDICGLGLACCCCQCKNSPFDLKSVGSLVFWLSSGFPPHLIWPCSYVLRLPAALELQLHNLSQGWAALKAEIISQVELNLGGQGEPNYSFMES